ncbi:MAG: hypothetical protein AB7T22_11880, partial [Calditrichaceae bacterium]
SFTCNNYRFEPLTKKTITINTLQGDYKMTLQEAYNFFENLKIETTNKSEIKVYEKFSHVLSELKSREFSKDEIQSIEAKLDSLNLESNPEKGKKFFKKVLIDFEKYLKDTFSLTSKGYYTSIGIGLGSSFGILLGIVFLSSLERSLGISLGIIIGMITGLIIGQSMDAKAKGESRVF